MIVIFCSMYIEASSIIKNYELQSTDMFYPYKAFVSDSITLLITGTGKIRSSCAVSFLFAKMSAQSIDFVINFGICAGNDKNALYLMNSVVDASTNRKYYPDMVIASDIFEGQLITSDVVINHISEDDVHLYDMEASAVFEATSFYFSPSKIAIIKCVSDNDGGENLTRDNVLNLVESHIGELEKYISSVNLITNNQKNESIDERILLLTDKYSNEIFASEYMRNELRSVIRYCILSEIDFDSLISPFLPVNCRKEGKIVLEKLNEKLF